MKISNILKVSFSAIFILFVTALVNFWFEYSNQAENIYEKFIGPILDGLRIPLYIVIIAIGTIIVTATAIYRHKVSQLEEKISEMEEKTSSEIQILVSANRQLSNYRFQENLEGIFRKFMTRNKYVHAVQAYRFEEKNYGNMTEITLNFLSGSVYNKVNINAIHQMGFQVSRKDLKKFRSVIDLIKRGSSIEMIRFLIESTVTLEEAENLKDEEVGLYMLMKLGMETLESKMGIDISFPFTRKREDKLEELLNSRRTGLIKAGILKSGFYSFTYEGSNEKANRQYLSSLAIIGGEPHLFSIALDSSVLEEDYEDTLNTVKEEFTILLNELKIGYNNQ